MARQVKRRPGQAAWNSGGPAGSTPLDPDEAEGLIPAWVATRGDLNEAEQANMLDALDRRRWRRILTDKLLDDAALPRSSVPGRPVDDRYAMSLPGSTLSA
jgi:hypothetical protein